jgi:hypothetical protein
MESRCLWVALLNQFEQMVQAMFDVSITVQIGDGTKALFWSDHWLDGSSFELLAPEVVAVVQKHPCKTRLVIDAL